MKRNGFLLLECMVAIVGFLFLSSIVIGSALSLLRTYRTIGMQFDRFCTVHALLDRCVLDMRCARMDRLYWLFLDGEVRWESSSGVRFRWCIGSDGLLRRVVHGVSHVMYDRPVRWHVTPLYRDRFFTGVHILCVIDGVVFERYVALLLRG